MKYNFIQIGVIGFLFLTISGCSIGGTYYFRNFTSEPALVILTFTEPASNMYDEPNYTYATEIRPIKTNLYKKLNRSLPGEYLSDRTVKFYMPPTSTLFFAVGTNMKLWGIKSIKIESTKGIEIIDPGDNETLNIKMRGIGQYTGHYDIKE